MCKQQWLKQIHHTEKADFWSDEEVGVTNQQILEMKEEDRPVEWWNGFEASQEEIERRRKESKNSYTWMRDLQQHAPHLDIKTERALKKEMSKWHEIDTCGQIIKVMTKKGIIKEVHKHCGHVECAKCRRYAEKQLEEKLYSLDGCRFMEVTKEQRAQLCKTYTKAQCFFKQIDEERILAIIDTDDEIGQEFTYNHVKQYSSLPPKGSKTSGKLDKREKKSCTPKEEKKEVIGEYKELSIQLPANTSKEISEKIDLEFYQQTLNFQPLTFDDYLKDLKKMEKIYIDIALKYCENIHYLTRSVVSIYIEDLDFSDRRKFITSLLEKAKIPLI